LRLLPLCLRISLQPIFHQPNAGVGVFGVSFALIFVPKRASGRVKIIKTAHKNLVFQEVFEAANSFLLGL